jgi:hypothetical protein
MSGTSYLFIDAAPVASPRSRMGLLGDARNSMLPEMSLETAKFEGIWPSVRGDEQRYVYVTTEISREISVRIEKRIMQSRDTGAENPTCGQRSSLRSASAANDCFAMSSMLSR